MEIIEGKQTGTKIYVYDNYTYTVDKRFPHIYRCSKRKTVKCSGRIKKEGEQYILICPHNHHENPCVVQSSNLKREMIRLCQETTKPLKNIFDTVCRTDLQAAIHMTYNNVKSTLNHYRALSRPVIPSDLHGLCEQLENYEPTRSIYKGYAVSMDNKIALIFTNESLLHLLSEAYEIFVDGTFSVPKKPNIAQLYTVHVRYADTGIVTVFALCEGRSCSFYEAMWEKLVSLAPGLQTNLKFIMADYEKAAISAMSKQFPVATINGCWFHYSQALRRKWRRLGLSDAPPQILYMAQAIALAPCHLFQQALNIVQRCVVTFLIEYPAINEFIAYIERTWLPLASKVSVYGCPNRTNNLVESFYASITKQLSSSNLWKFLECIDNIISDQSINYERLKLGHPIKQLPTKRSLCKNKRIEQAQKDLVNERISLQQFLQLFGQPAEIFVTNDEYSFL